MADASNEILVVVPEAQLHEVNAGKESLAEWGELQLSIHSQEGVSGLWIKVGKAEWSFDATTPVLKAAERTYMFAMGGARFYSVLLAQGTPQETLTLFEEILTECTSYEVAGAMTKQATEQAVSEVAEDVVSSDLNDDDAPLVITPQQQQPGHKRTPSDRIMSGAAAVQGKLLASANWASQKIIDQSRAMQAKTEASQQANISPQFAARVKLARRAAEKGNRAANRVAGGIADISVKLADSIVSRMGPNNKYGQQLNDPAQKPNAAKEVAAAAVVAAVGIYDSMEQASRIVLNSGGQATSEFIGHKYGKDAGEVAKDATSASITTGMTAMTMQKIGVKKVARRIAKRTATGLAKSYLLPPNYKEQGAAGPSGQQQTQQGVPQLQGSQPPYQQGQQSAYQQGAVQQPGQAQFGAYGQPPSQGPTANVAHAAPMRASVPPQVNESAPSAVEYQSPFANN